MTHLIRMPEVLKRVGVSRTTLYQMLAKGAFVQPVRISERAIGFRSDEVDAWFEALVKAPRAPRPTQASQP
jgi:prophage regulatory protein